MRRALHIGLFIGTLLGVSACATADDGIWLDRGRPDELICPIKEFVAKATAFG